MSSPCVFRRGHHHHVERDRHGGGEEDIAEPGQEPDHRFLPFMAVERAPRGIGHHHRHGPGQRQPEPRARSQMPTDTDRPRHMDRRKPGIAQREPDHRRTRRQKPGRAIVGRRQPHQRPHHHGSPKARPERIPGRKRQHDRQRRGRDERPEHANNRPGHVSVPQRLHDGSPSSFQKYVLGSARGARATQTERRTGCAKPPSRGSARCSLDRSTGAIISFAEPLTAPPPST
jgi:hypothetical protein